MTTEFTKSMEFAFSMTQQVITLASGFLALSLAVFKDVARTNPSALARRLLFCTWVLLIFSVLFGLLTIGAITGVAASPPNGIGIFDGGARILALIQVGCFFVGVVVLLTFGWLVFPRTQQEQPGAIGLTVASRGKTTKEHGGTIVPSLGAASEVPTTSESLSAIAGQGNDVPQTECGSE